LADEKLKLPPIEQLALPPHRQESFRLIGREEQELAAKMRDAKGRLAARRRPWLALVEKIVRQAPLPNRKRQNDKSVVLCAILCVLYPPDGRVPDHVGKLELHRQITPQLWQGAWRKLIGTNPPGVPNPNTVDAVRRSLA
jgi:hypothetical protein